jgi:hypothetical protein
MAKKTRRSRGRKPNVGQPVRISPPSRPLASQAAPKQVDFAKEYAYVVDDLKRIAIIAAALLVLLVVLALILG